MLSPLVRRRVPPRRFHYEPRFYDPTEDERGRRRVRIERRRARPPSKQPRAVAVAVGLLIALYLYLNVDALAERAAAFGGALFGG